MLPLAASSGFGMQNILEMVAIILTILTSLIALIRVLILTPLDKKLDAHTDRMLVTIEHRFLDAITKRIDAIEHISHSRSRQGVLWGRALYEALREQGIKAPNPEMYVWEPTKTGADQ